MVNALNFVEFVHPDVLSPRMEQFLKILEGAKQATEYRLFTKDGTIKWARTHARPIRQHGQVVGVQGILVDITDRKVMEILSADQMPGPGRAIG